MKNGNLNAVEATVISLSRDKDFVAVAIVGGKAPLICKDEDLIKHYDDIIRHDLANAYINFETHQFRNMIVKEVVDMVVKEHPEFADLAELSEPTNYEDLKDLLLK